MSKRKATKAKPQKAVKKASKKPASNARKGATARPSASPAPAASASSAFDLKAVRDLARIANEYDLESVEVAADGGIRISRAAGSASGAAAPAAPVGAPAPIALVPPPASQAEPEAVVDDNAILINSPFVGTFYRSPSPDADSFVEVGQVIRKGQVVCIVEAMKLMNEIEAEADGKLLEVLVKNGEHVEYGQALFRLAKL